MRFKDRLKFIGFNLGIDVKQAVDTVTDFVKPYTAYDREERFYYYDGRIISKDGIVYKGITASKDIVIHSSEDGTVLTVIKKGTKGGYISNTSCLYHDKDDTTYPWLEDGCYITDSCRIRSSTLTNGTVLLDEVKVVNSCISGAKLKYTNVKNSLINGDFSISGHPWIDNNTEHPTAITIIKDSCLEGKGIIHGICSVIDSTISGSVTMVNSDVRKSNIKGNVFLNQSYIKECIIKDCDMSVVKSRLFGPAKVNGKLTLVDSDYFADEEGITLSGDIVITYGSGYRVHGNIVGAHKITNIDECYDKLSTTDIIETRSTTSRYNKFENRQKDEKYTKYLIDLNRASYCAELKIKRDVENILKCSDCSKYVKNSIMELFEHEVDLLKRDSLEVREKEFGIYFHGYDKPQYW